MAKIHPFPGVRIVPPDYTRYLITETTVYTVEREVYALTPEQAIRSFQHGGGANETIGVSTIGPTAEEHPDDALRGDDFDEDQHDRDGS